MAFSEKRSRTFTKTIGYRILIIITNSIVIFILTRRIDITLGASVAMAVINTILYYLYERIWNNVHWGKVKIKQ